MASKNPKFAAWLQLRVTKYRMKVMVKKCDGFCGQKEYHTHDLTFIGKFYYIYRHKIVQYLVPDNRPQPPVDERVGAPWISEYNAAWVKEYPGYTPASEYVRDQRGFWVWVTNTPQFDRNWFDEKGWQFPAAWITVNSKAFYKVGEDALSTVVALPLPDGSTTVDKSEVF